MYVQVSLSPPRRPRHSLGAPQYPASNRQSLLGVALQACPPMASPHSMSVDQMRQILREVIDSLESPDYAGKLNEAKEAAGNEMLKMMQIVFPMVVQIEMETIKRHGFCNSREGIVQFTQMVRDMETLDGEVARLHNKIRNYYLPPVSISSSVDTSL